MIREALAVLRAPGFLRSVGVLVSGTAFSAGITAAALPVLTRLYTPGDFSVLAVFAGVVSIISVAACLRFDLAIPMPENDTDAANVAALALLCTLVISVVVSIAIVTAPESAILSISQPRLIPYLWLIPPSVLLAGSYSVLQFWFVRAKKFERISGVRIVQACGGSGCQVGCGLFGWAPFGLIVGQLVNNAAGCIGLGYSIVRTNRHLIRTISWRRMRFLFSFYDRFPKYSTLEALTNSAGIQLPIIMIGSLAAGPEAGFLLLALYLMQGPMSVVGNAIAQVYLSRAPEEDRAGRLGSFTSSVFGALIKSGVGPLIFTGILAPVLFGRIFGDEWYRAGQLMMWMTPSFVLQFLAVPISMGLHVTNHQKTALVLQLVGLIARVAAVCGASFFVSGLISEAYAVSGFLFYLGYLGTVFWATRTSAVDVLRQSRQALPVALSWTFAGCAIALSDFLLRG